MTVNSMLIADDTPRDAGDDRCRPPAAGTD